MLSETLFGLLGLLLGGLIGHRLAIWRDKRQEFNEVAAPVMRNLLEIEEQATAGFLWKRLDGHLIGEVKPYLSDRERKKLQKLVKNLERSIEETFPVNKEKPYEGSEPVKEFFPEIERAAKKLRRFLRVR